MFNAAPAQVLLWTRTNRQPHPPDLAVRASLPLRLRRCRDFDGVAGLVFFDLEN
jgi:hypothetical protein